ncbi:MAG: type II toxin-antitoxin system RelE/ParE family toxin [Chloroherpetonaceae bacterium]|nr:type II toxin-antitoxin system RelE/ParE family toxin [Chloroherpetonaceae bacterium]
MNYKILLTVCFEKELKRLAKKFPSLKVDFSKLVTELSLKPLSGDSLGNNCYKVRVAVSSKGKGKSGGARVITYIYFEKETIYLLTIYDKSEMQDLKPNELKEMIQNLPFD